MIKQRQTVKLYREGGREELALSEEEEIETIRRFMPEQMDEAAISAITAALEETGAESIKDMAQRWTVETAPCRTDGLRRCQRHDQEISSAELLSWRHALKGGLAQ